MKFIDDPLTTEVETIRDVVTLALKKGSVVLDTLLSERFGLEWYKHNKAGVHHLIKSLKGFGRPALQVGGWGDIVNAIKGSHGPSWRMIVHLTTPTEAYGVYPGGQDGNPGSRFFDNNIDTWVEGKYNSLWFMREGDRKDNKVKWVMKFRKGSS